MALKGIFYYYWLSVQQCDWAWCDIWPENECGTLAHIPQRYKSTHFLAHLIASNKRLQTWGPIYYSIMSGSGFVLGSPRLLLQKIFKDGYLEIFSIRKYWMFQVARPINSLEQKAFELHLETMDLYFWIAVEYSTRHEEGKVWSHLTLQNSSKSSRSFFWGEFPWL